MTRTYQAIVKRPGKGNVVAKVRGYNDTHVIVDLFIDGKLRCENYARPIERFMTTYGLSD